MPKIKIVSNPYKKEVKYQRWNTDESQWTDIDYDNNKNSDLLKSELTGGFFPFKVKKIVDLMVKEYGIIGGDESLEIVFEGSADEFTELEAACEDEKYGGKIKPSKSVAYLENARDILPEVRNLFKEMSELILRSVNPEKIQKDLSRFTDASSDVVPICVLGNYSTGKSTFINALIGSEILPSGSEPVTAKIYKISRSKFADRAYIKCKYLGYDVEIQFTDKDTRFEDVVVENALSTALKAALDEMIGEDIPSRVNKALSVINDYEFEKEVPEISDLIEVDIPFVNGVLAKTQHPFVVFDTPGSNSASNARHLQVLKEAMANMTNGLPIFLCTPDSLDSTDNENLYHIIRDLEELDNRFTMIVVNKADSAGIQRREASEAEQNRILTQAVPRNLYSGGLFYVSSILGLGAKTDGKFKDYVYEDIYDAQEDRYDNPDNKHYRTLYHFNIQPSQLKRRSDELAESQKDRLVYTNSGLFSVETEIEAFAGKYSAYNKCFQSQMFLTRVIDITEDEIEDKKKESEEIRQGIKDKLEADKQALSNRLEESASQDREDFVKSYFEHMQPFLEQANDAFSTDDLRSQEATFTKEHEEKQAFEEATDVAKKARESLVDNLKAGITMAIKDKNAASFKNLWDTFQSDVSKSMDSYQNQRETRHKVDKEAADSLLKYVTDAYETKLQDIYDLLDSKSREYWTGKTEQLRNTLAEIVSGSEVLTEERRKELERIIITYKKLMFRDDAVDTIFDKVNFERRIKIGDQVLWESDHLNIDKLAKTYNSNIVTGANTRYASIEKSHRESAFDWIQSLLDEINENIVEYSPELSKQAKRIKIMTEQILELEDRQDKLRNYTDKLRRMMDWKTIEK